MAVLYAVVSDQYCLLFYGRFIILLTLPGFSVFSALSSVCLSTVTGGFLGGDESCPSMESLVNWLLEHDDAGLGELSDDSDVLLSYIDESWSDRESLLMEDVPNDDEVPAGSVLFCLPWLAID